MNKNNENTLVKNNHEVNSSFKYVPYDACTLQSFENHESSEASMLSSGEHPPGGTRILTTRCPKEWLDLHHHPMSSLVTEKWNKSLENANNQDGIVSYF